MALTVAQILTAARDRHASFHKSRVPDGVLARRLTNYQRELISQVSDIDPSLVAQQASIVFATGAENAIGTVGAGTSGGQPGKLSVQNPLVVQEPAGSLIEEDLANAQELLVPTVPTSATANTLTKTGAGWTVNAFAGKLVEITDGPGARQVREILSNTTDTLTLKTGTTWEVIPTVASRFRIIAVLFVVSKEMGVVTELAPLAQRAGYLVRLDATGAPYIDYGKPLIARFDEGIELPPHETVLVPGTVRFVDDRGTDELEIRPYAARRGKGYRYTSWLENGALFLGGQRDLWKDVDSIDLRYVPIAPDITKLTDVLLLPDSSSSCLVAAIALYAGERHNTLPDVPKVELGPLERAAARAEDTFLKAMGRQARMVPTFVQDDWP